MSLISPIKLNNNYPRTKKVILKQHIIPLRECSPAVAFFHQHFHDYFQLIPSAHPQNAQDGVFCCPAGITVHQDYQQHEAHYLYRSSSFDQSLTALLNHSDSELSPVLFCQSQHDPRNCSSKITENENKKLTKENPPIYRYKTFI